MWVLVTYDVRTETPAGRRRLRRVAKACAGFGQRVQKSVFECQLDDASWARLRGRLLEEISCKEDSLRFYFLGEDGAQRVEHHGIGESWDMEGPLVL